MGRFLTPSKVALLVLARLYTKGAVPLSGTAKVLHVLASRILFDSKDSDELLQHQSIDSILDLERALGGQPSNIPGRTVWDILLRDLWTIDCSAALDGFIADGPSLLGKTRDQLLRERDEGLPPEDAGKIVRTSPLGVFIRRCAIEHQGVRFHDSAQLWVDLIAYRLPSKGAYTRKNPQKLKHTFDSNLADLDIDISHPLASILFRPMLDTASDPQSLYSTHDSEKLMEFQVSEMQSFGGRLPDSMRARLKTMATDGGTSTPKLMHYLNFLDSWRAGSFTSAYDALHRYFDYTMHSHSRTYYQYALLNVAILHADFGNHDLAIPAMTEAIATARENRDTVCLNYCMSWLYHFGRAFPSAMSKSRETGILGHEIEGLNFLKSRAKEAEMWTLLSTSLLSEAKISLQHGESLASVFENIVKAGHISTVKQIPNSNGPSLLMKSNVFARIGQTHAAYAAADRFLLCYSKEAPLEDLLKCTVRQASLLAQMGRLSEAETTIAGMPAHVLKVLKYSTYHTTYTLILRAKRLLHRTQLEAAKDIIDLLVSQQPHPDIDTSTQVSLLEIDLLTRQREYMTALDKIHALADKTTLEHNDVALKARLLVLKASLYGKSGKALGAFSLAMRAVDMAYKARVLPVLWEAVLALANILLEAYEFAAARDLLQAILPQVLECLDCELAGGTYLLLADCFVGLAGLEGAAGNVSDTGKEKAGKQESKQGSKQMQKQLMSSAMEILEKAGEQFRWIEELDGQLEVLAKMGRICMWRGDVALANEMGERYSGLRKSYQEEEV